MTLNNISYNSQLEIDSNGGGYWLILNKIVSFPNYDVYQ